MIAHRYEVEKFNVEQPRSDAYATLIRKASPSFSSIGSAVGRIGSEGEIYAGLLSFFLVFYFGNPKCRCSTSTTGTRPTCRLAYPFFVILRNQLVEKFEKSDGACI